MRRLTRPASARIRPVAGGLEEEGLSAGLRSAAFCFLSVQSFPPAPQQHPQNLSELRPERAQSLLTARNLRGPGEDRKSSDSASPHQPTDRHG